MIDCVFIILNINPSFSPDGQHIAYFEKKCDKQYVLVIQSLVGNSKIEHGNFWRVWADQRPSWSSDGQTIVFSAVKNNGAYDQLFFFSREEDRMHVHIVSSDGEAKFWLEPEIELAKNYHYNRKQLKDVERIIEERQNELVSAWEEHFGN